MTQPPYDAGTARATAIGASGEGWVESTGVWWDDDVARWSLQAIEQRATLTSLVTRADLAALRRDIRALRGIARTPVRILGIGDSITVGYKSSDAKGYVTPLLDMLDWDHLAGTLDLCAVPGYTLRQITPMVADALASHPPDYVLIAIGSNDAATGDLGTWATRYAALVDQVLASSPTVRVVCARLTISMAPYAPAEATINGYVDQVVAARVAGGRVLAADMSLIPSRWTEDGVHPGDPAYLYMALLWMRALRQWLPTPP